jgi:hypothetical protein
VSSILTMAWGKSSAVMSRAAKASSCKMNIQKKTRKRKYVLLFSNRLAKIVPGRKKQVDGWHG